MNFKNDFENSGYKLTRPEKPFLKGCAGKTKQDFKRF